MTAIGVHPCGAFAQLKSSSPTTAEGASTGPVDSASVEFFESKIRPILVARCQNCHGSDKQEANLRLDSRSSIVNGGDSGSAIVPFDPEHSLMIAAIRYSEDRQMPPKQKLPTAEISLLEEWVRRGAPWSSDDEHGSVSHAKQLDIEDRKRSHWAWKPITPPEIPAEEINDSKASAIDVLLLTKLQAAGLQPAGPAEKRTLIRRASFDLIGLPPTPEDIAAFEDDSSADAFAKVVDRLLASPYFGERWARHWLDLVRYAETLGHEFDYPVTNAWQYRDYVIRALNADVPYDQFVREHLVGDLLPEPRLHPTEGFNESVIGTAFWYLGEALHSPVDSRADYATRIENQIDVVTKTFLGLTVGCARCHDHKFDAISTRDYYALAGFLTSSHQQQALLDSGGRIEKSAQQLAEVKERGRAEWMSLLPADTADSARRFARCLLASQMVRDISNQTELENIAQDYQVDGQLLHRFCAQIASAQDPKHPFHVWAKLTAPQLPEESFLTRLTALEASIEQQRDPTKDVEQHEQVFEDFSRGFEKWFASGWAFGNSPTKCGDWLALPGRAELLPAGIAHSGRFGAKLQGVLRSPTFTIEQPLILYHLGGRNAQVRLIVDGYVMDEFSELLFEGLSFKVDTSAATEWRAQSVAKYLGHSAHIELIDHGDGFIAVDEIRFAASGATGPQEETITTCILAKNSIGSSEALAATYGDVWKKGLDDWRQSKSSTEAEFVRWGISQELLNADDTAQQQIADLAKNAIEIDATIPDPLKVVAIADGSSVDQAIQIRGNYKNLGNVVPRRFLEAIAGDEPLRPAHGSGRLELAERILAASDPFPARVMVNRIWHHLFGRGIVASVDNFGVLGMPPTNPELLDYLADRFRSEGWSVKKLIQEIVLSQAYQRSSIGSASAEQIDPQNLLLHRANVRRLEGEVIRDSLLYISGRLDSRQFGPSVPIYLSPFMEGRGRPKQSGPLDGNGRRSVYLEVRRNFLSPFMVAFDTPQPTSTIGRRNVSNVPAQALFLLNDPFVLEQCKCWATRALKEPDTSQDCQVQRLFLSAFGRPASPAELDEALDFLQEQTQIYGARSDDARPWTDLCHVLVNSKEFIFVQ